MITLSMCILFGVLGLVGLIFLGLPLLMLAAILPRLLMIGAVVLAAKGLMDKPTQKENFYPAAICLAMAVVLRWIF